MLGLGYTGAELVANLRSALPAVIVDFALNFTPGVLAGLFLKWKPLAAVLLGGVTYVSSSGVIAKLLAELRRLNNPETPAVLSILVLEDLTWPSICLSLLSFSPVVARQEWPCLSPWHSPLSFWFLPWLSATGCP
jgi:Kef-type K+ transport system membrane component KefB